MSRLYGFVQGVNGCARAYGLWNLLLAWPSGPAAIPRNTVALAVKCCKLQILAHIQKYKYVWLMFMLSPLAEDNSAQFWGHTSQNARSQTTQPLYAFLLSPSISPANNQRPYGKHTPMVHWLLWLLLKEWAVAWFRGVSGASLKGKII